MEMVHKIRAALDGKGLKQKDLVLLLGESQSAIAKWLSLNEDVRNDIPITILSKLADILDLDIDFLIGKTEKTRPTYRPLIGSASCGVPTTYYYDDVEMIAAPDGVSKNSYYVKADGDSMTPRINSGDLILCDPDCEVSSGNIVHFEWDGEHGVKRYVEQGNIRMMVSTNSDYQPLLITDEYELRMTRCIQVTADL